MYNHHHHQQQQQQQQQCMLRPGQVAHPRHYAGLALAPPTYEEHVMHYPAANERIPAYQYPSAAHYADYDPEGRFIDHCPSGTKSIKIL